MHSAITWFEIPVGDLARAQTFYEALLERPMRGTEDIGGQVIAVFPHEKPGAGGSLVQRTGHRPARDGTRVYLDCAPDLDAAIARAQAAGGKVAVPKTLIAPGVGYFAHIEDLDGNLVGLHGPV
ncbi:MAG: VOC family protein [Burkholderiaceae bacterium]